MAIQFYNTLNRRKEEFKEIEPGKVTFYSCGPTVYDFAHIGNLKTFIVYDLIKRYLLYRGYEVHHVMNITDVEDKIIRRVKDEETTLEAVTEAYTKAFFEDMETLNIQLADDYPKATEHITEMVEMIHRMVEDGHAYVRDESVYFSIQSFPKYGELAQLDVKGMQTGASGVDSDEYEKDNVRDFVLWKAWKEDDGDVFWKTDLGKGRPGWHMECSCMSIKYLGETIDIHAGAVDLIFPHHQNEIAQSEAVTGKQFVNYWLHGAHINVDDTKMSKSLGNYLTVRDIVKSPDDARAFRYLVVSSHYRTAFNFSKEVLDAARNTTRRLLGFRKRLQEVDQAGNGQNVSEMVEKARAGFVAFMDDDLNSPRAMAAVFELVNAVEGLLGEEKVDREGAALVDGFMEEINQVLGVFYTLPGDEEEDGDLSEELQALIVEREQARKDKNWARADEIRDRLLEEGYVLEDTAEGTLCKKA
ncbi:MAG: cysteine--tRNA ligase [bacterium]|nr:cysteine--tRNA ligase [bacterium]